jgi:hypothetical protein
MTGTLMNEVANATIIDIISPALQQYKLHCLKKKLKNCPPTDLAHDSESSMPIGLIIKDGCILPIQESPQKNHLQIHPQT